MLFSFRKEVSEAGCDEAGRGCLAGPVYAAAVVLAADMDPALLPGLDDSKQLSEAERNGLRPLIEKHALSWAVASVDHEVIDRINILNASYMAMHRAIKKLSVRPGLLLIDGNRFKPYPGIPHCCFVKGDANYAAIAAASILAKTERDAFMEKLHRKFPHYGWMENKGYATPSHKKAVLQYGPSPYHRRSFNAYIQGKLFSK